MKHFSWKIIHKIWWKTIPRPFSKNQNWAYLWINSAIIQFYITCFYCILRCRPLFFTSYKAFFKKKGVWNKSPCLIFCITLKKKISVIFHYLTKFYSLVALTLSDIGQYSIGYLFVNKAVTLFDIQNRCDKVATIFNFEIKEELKIWKKVMLFTS